MKNKLNNPVFICGHRKSGTSLFRNLLDGHDKLLVYPTDLNLLYAYFPDFIKKVENEVILLDRLKNILFKELKSILVSEGKIHLIDMDVFEETFFKNIEINKLRDIKYILSHLISTYYDIVYSNREDNFRLLLPVLKETSIEIYSNEIIKWFPGARFIQIIRDPRDNYGALKAGVSSYYSKIGENEHETLASLINRAKLGMNYANANKNMLGSEYYLVIKFEDLVAKPEKTLMDVSKFLKIRFNSKMLTPTMLGESTKGNSFDKNKRFNKISKENVSSWKKRITDYEAQVIEFFFKDTMQHFGYDLAFPEDESMKSAADYYKWYNYKYFYSDRFLQ